MAANKSALLQARIVDVAAFLRMRSADARVGARKIAKGLGCKVRVAQLLMAGTHWQQNPAKVRAFNELRGTAIDPATGIAPAEDIARCGGLFDGASAGPGNQSTKDLTSVLRAAGHGDKAGEIASRLTALEVGELSAPERLDTEMFLRLMRERLWQALKLMTPDVIAKAGLRDLSSSISMLTEKIELLEGRPTSIVRSDQRVGLDKVTALLFAEARRRGVTIEAAKGADYREGGE